MNIFYLDACPFASARMLCDKHVVKMIVETCQILSTVKHHYNDVDHDFTVYSPTHRHHPSVRWTTESNEHYTWLWQHLVGLLNEYEHRYSRKHKCAEMVNILMVPPLAMPRVPFTEPPPAMDAKYIVKGDSSVASYRNYYIHGKSHLTKNEYGRWLYRNRHNLQHG